IRADTTSMRFSYARHVLDRSRIITRMNYLSVDLDPQYGRLKVETNPNILSFWFLLFGFESPADPEHVAIGMAKVDILDVPRHIGGRKCDLQPGGDAVLVHLVHVVHPNRHPDALVAPFVSVLLKGGGVRAAAAASLRLLTKKDASFLTRSNRAKRRRRSPVPQFLPSPLLNPRDRAGDVGHVQYRSQTFDFHNGSRITPGGPRDLVDGCKISVALRIPVLSEIVAITLATRFSVQAPDFTYYPWSHYEPRFPPRESHTTLMFRAADPPMSG